jgi:hypothetical protein
MARVKSTGNAGTAKPKAAPKAQAAPTEGTTEANAAPAAAAVKPTSAKPTEAKNRPAVTTKRVHTEEMKLGNEGKVSFDASGEKQSEVLDIEVENSLDTLNDKARHLAFLEEEVTIQLAEDTNKNPETHIFCQVNGVGPGPGGVPWIPRGVPVTIKRKFLQVLARARPVRYRNNEYVDQNSGERKTEQIASSAQKYPFSVIRDDNPRGVEWLTNLFRQSVRR